ncbi:DUF4271 domain-containing protein [Pedobacter duraquae]|uniref:Uncharacterized protein DUF4271 n=1 Tax=Pedobacter duraquae TaxID=425511 RepID=A0A4V3C3D3_9SPHI|nr:DUF4271 domain-containing protein [Pedobacter duraquae]TDO21588.1 uncharacterized protein DUF4271 [Pedobacter duraquae]
MLKCLLNTFILLAFFFTASAQQKIIIPPVDTAVRTTVYIPKRIRDSAFMAQSKRITDSITTHTWIIPDSLLSKSIIIDSILKANVYDRPAGEPWYVIHGIKKKTSPYRTGKALPKGEFWVLSFLGGLLLIFAILRYAFNRQLETIIHAFYSNRILNNLNKEDNLFTSWPFLLLFIQFGFTIGLFLYLVAQYYQVSYGAGGFQFFITISVIIVVLYALKIVLLRVIGHIFNVQKPVHEYISILYLSYFNSSLIFIPLVVAFALSPLKYGLYYIVISFILLAIIFAFQFIRAGVNILSNNRFSKVYLFLYFCALEICPILILIKAIGF